MWCWKQRRSSERLCRCWQVVCLLGLLSVGSIAAPLLATEGACAATTGGRCCAAEKVEFVGMDCCQCVG